MEHTIIISFYTRISRKTIDNMVLVYLRISVNGKRIEHAINRLVPISMWSASYGRMKGISPESKTLNDYLDVLKIRYMLPKGR